ncbi:hypothetical protein [Vulcanisaeta sp. JCM 16159]|uniref:hypothetical protein n=1 Tax=Vulcanisaeta sp. JCM 16159 TaxID=1295371 RepID=UPI001FB5254F|nr:hypothetical protein [Vulcanisaeta sp. JCM 16159]
MGSLVMALAVAFVCTAPAPGEALFRCAWVWAAFVRVVPTLPWGGRREALFNASARGCE